jgi:hypothetical protein
MTASTPDTTDFRPDITAPHIDTAASRTDMNDFRSDIAPQNAAKPNFYLKIAQYTRKTVQSSKVQGSRDYLP